ncbi:hypothetical protein Axy09_011 [Achromobacter phage vB_AxyP_19-32_Axy09]|uniref:Uncharacterized protein n=1 Tax=Achromobacter phage vB_AxyP_19-32_Axy09 TaxID=2591040 RepID=A0A514CTV2_9CAUD|nr:hypothetical protein Axy09_011 [Achromobacter phage vB_AxyP_19-32_Axy09]
MRDFTPRSTREISHIETQQEAGTGRIRLRAVAPNGTTFGSIGSNHAEAAQALRVEVEAAGYTLVE